MYFQFVRTTDKTRFYMFSRSIKTNVPASIILMRTRVNIPRHRNRVEYSIIVTCSDILSWPKQLLVALNK